MTRNEERKQEAINHCTYHIKTSNGLVNTIDNDKYNGFIAGARWADETMIEKAVEWLINNVNDYIINDKQDDGRDWLKVKSEMFNDFKKAMEE